MFSVERIEKSTFMMIFDLIGIMRNTSVKRAYSKNFCIPSTLVKNQSDKLPGHMKLARSIALVRAVFLFDASY